MVWGMVMSNGYLHIQSIEGRVNSKIYQNFLSQHIKPVLDDMFPDGNYLFQQDNCPAHVSKSTRDWLSANSIATFDWPSRSPDLNIIENVWKLMSDIIYDGKVQFNTIDELWCAIDEATTRINTDFFEKVDNLFKSIPKRLVSVIQSRGDLVEY